MSEQLMQTSNVRIGGYLSLISNSNIRYEGQLDFVDSTGNKVTLRNVRVLGTEGRLGGGPNEVPASDQVFETIVFRGTDIAKLTVFQNSVQTRDPAIVSATPATANNNNNNSNNHSNNHVGNSNFYDNPRDNNGRNYGGSNNYNSGRGGRGRYNGDGGGRGRYNNSGHRGGYGGRGRKRFPAHTGREFRAAEGDEKVTFKEEFDFAQCRAEFEKNRSEFEKAKEEAKSQGHAYNKSSDFFDTISCDEKERSQGTRVNRDEMDRADKETFGENLAGNMRGYRRGRGGRGRYNSNSGN